MENKLDVFADLVLHDEPVMRIEAALDVGEEQPRERVGEAKRQRLQRLAQPKVVQDDAVVVHRVRPMDGKPARSRPLLSVLHLLDQLAASARREERRLPEALGFERPGSA